MSMPRLRLVPLALLSALIALGLPARAGGETDGPAALMAWMDGAGKDQLRRLDKRLGELPLDSAVRGLVAEMELSPPEARLALLFTGALKLRARQPDALPDCPKAALTARAPNPFELGLISRPPAGCAAAGGKALWGDGKIPSLDADARRAAVVAWLGDRPGSDWAGPEARARADWHNLIEGQLSAETLRAIGALNGLASADLEKLEKALRAVGDALPGIAGGSRAIMLHNLARALTHADPDLRLRLLVAGVAEALALDGHHATCARALEAAAGAESNADVPGLESCTVAVEEARRSTGRGEALPGAEQAATQKGASAALRAAGPAWSLLDSYIIWTTFEDDDGEQVSLRDTLLSLLAEVVPSSG